MPMNRLIMLSIFIAIIGCTNEGYVPSESSRVIYSALEANKFESINLSKFGGSKWTKVCFLGPYNENSQKALGFNWQVSEHTAVLVSDAHNVIVFATEKEVIEFVVHSRGSGDFWKLSGECLPRNNATLIRDPESGNWRNYIHKKA